MLNFMLLALFVAIQAADVLTTRKGFQLGAGEAMPLGKLLFSRLGFWPTVLLIKVAALALAIAATLLVRDAYWFTGAMNLIGAAVLRHNLKVIAAVKRALTQ
jgi:hypothetical protein